MSEQIGDARKSKILSIINMHGPSLPVRIASVAQISTLYTSAFLSELTADGKVKTSNMRVGSSPLYYLPGQEAMLENFIQHLNQREKEAFHVLKQRGIVNEDELTPVLRVAIRDIKDFAVPIQFQLDGQTKTFWRFFSVSESEARERITEIFEPKKKAEEKAEEKIQVKETKKDVNEERIDEVASTESRPKSLQVKIQKQKETEFGNYIREHLTAKEIEIIELISEKKKELEGKVGSDTMFGKQTYYLVAKDKKSVSDNDLAMALQKSQMHKMPALVVSGGELNKKAKEYLEHWGNLVKFEKIT